MIDSAPFAGFATPEQNWVKLPIELINLLPIIKTAAELKIILYVLRHTWGFQEFGKPKPISTDEFINGRKRDDGTRIDAGVGMTAPSVRSGIAAAVEHGFLQVAVDDSDRARIEKSYCLAMQSSQIEKDLPSPQPDRKRFTIHGKILSIRGKSFSIGRKILSIDQRKKLSKQTQSKKPHQRIISETIRQMVKIWISIQGDKVTAKTRDRLLDDIWQAVDQYGEGKVLQAVLKAEEQHERGTAIGSWKYVQTILEKSAAADQARRALVNKQPDYLSGKYAAFIDNRV